MATVRTDLMALGMDRKTALETINRIATRSKRRQVFQSVTTLVEKIFDTKTPTCELSLRLVYDTFVSNARVIVPSDEGENYLAIMDAMKRILLSRGYRDALEILTMQEHRLMGSGHNGYGDDHYTPIALLKKTMNLEEVRKARGLALVADEGFPDFFGLQGTDKQPYVHFSLMRLSDEGCTLGDPELVNVGKLIELYGAVPPEKLLELCTVTTSKTVDFPFRRG